MLFNGKKISNFKIQCRRCGSLYNNTSIWRKNKKGLAIPEECFEYDLIAELDEKHPKKAR
jgi:hypothetical protein